MIGSRRNDSLARRASEGHCSGSTAIPRRCLLTLPILEPRSGDIIKPGAKAPGIRNYSVAKPRRGDIETMVYAQVSPLRGLAMTCPHFRGLTPPATRCRRSAARPAHQQNWRVRLAWQVIFVLSSIGWVATCTLAADAKSFLFGKPFQDALAKKVGRAWSGVTLRDVVRDLSKESQLAILLDRRIDPTREIDLSLPPTPLRDVIAELAQSVGAETVIISNVVYIGPAGSTGKLRTLIDLRAKELAKLAPATKARSEDAKDKSVWRGRSTSLAQPKTFVWEDLDRPRDLLKQVADKFRFEIDDLSNLPHDLWAGSAMPQVTAVEALSLLLIQFNATFEFHSDSAAARVVAIPDDLPPTRPDSTKTTEPSGTSDKKNKTGKPASLRDTTVTLTASATVRELIASFKGNGIRFDYDSVQLELAGIKLDNKLDVDVKEVPADKFLKELFEPLDIKVTIVDDVVRLRPKTKD